MIRLPDIGTPAQRALVASFLRFGVVGASGFLVDTAVVYAAKGALGLNGAGIPAYLAAATWTWAFNRWWTFRGQGSGPMWRQWLRFLAANMTGFVLNRGAYFLLIAFSQTCRTYPVIAVGAGAIAGMFANFVASRRLVFR